MLVYRHSEYKKAQAKYSEVLDRKVELLKVNKQPRISMQKKNAAKKELQTLTAQSKILKKEVWQVRKLLMQIKSRPHTNNRGGKPIHNGYAMNMAEPAIRAPGTSREQSVNIHAMR